MFKKNFIIKCLEEEKEIFYVKRDVNDEFVCLIIIINFSYNFRNFVYKYYNIFNIFEKF